MVKNICTVILFLSLSFFSCSDTVVVNSDIGQIKLDLLIDDDPIGTNSSIVLSDIALLKDFSLDYYPGLREAILVVNVKTSSAINKCIVELFNLESGASIPMSNTETTSTDYIWLESENMVDNLPRKRSDLTLKLTSAADLPPNTAFVRNASLYLYF